MAMLFVFLLASILASSASAEQMSETSVSPGIKKYEILKKSKEAHAVEEDLGKAVAFIVATETYGKQLPPLEGTTTLAGSIKDVLLTDYGFGAVYIADGAAASIPSILKCLVLSAPNSVTTSPYSEREREGRFLIWFLGHGQDYGGLTSCIQLAGADDKDPSSQVIPVSLLLDYLHSLKGIKHLAMIVDTCKSGLGLSSNVSGRTDFRPSGTYDGNGSRCIISAGMGRQNAYVTRYRNADITNRSRI